ncbi:AcrR family transcriptional regulator [Enterococcus sp. PF1-24]|uniref:TetR/AcrR family transcriptional regulator n=1 Tax=unclassified Enterococcus TaxID=2608891 RepID=UPI0024766A06|nr:MULTISPECIES: TetR/AcrR family transcriptional regulator [unclassified Enterococcus]MDH6364801.1 AcrR family transcriptional regulator [Enterococcus sp. PFB1-1]MDH6401854.1 AcrR family transcriptional regulator [Enterococcus sp. PF1-24]
MANTYNVEQNKITKESIFIALMSIMEKKDFKNISITEVTKKAGVSRMAFYRNYQILEDILTEHLEALFMEYAALLESKEFSNYEMTRLYFYCFRQHQFFIINLLRSKMNQLILDQSVGFLDEFSKSIVCTIDCTPEFEKYNIHFIAGGILNVLIAWCMNGMEETDELMAELVCERLTPHIIGISA